MFLLQFQKLTLLPIQNVSQTVHVIYICSSHLLLYALPSHPDIGDQHGHCCTILSTTVSFCYFTVYFRYVTVGFAVSFYGMFYCSRASLILNAFKACCRCSAYFVVSASFTFKIRCKNSHYPLRNTCHK